MPEFNNLLKCLLGLFIVFLSDQSGIAQSISLVQAINGPGNEIANALTVNKGGSVIGAITFDQSIELGGEVFSSSGRKDVLLFQYLMESDQLGWIKQLGSKLDDELPAIQATTGGRFVVAGEYGLEINIGDQKLQTEESTKGLYVSCFQQNGQPMWTQSLQGSGVQHLTDLAVDSLGNVYATGYYESMLRTAQDSLPGTGEQDLFVIKYDSGGRQIWQFGAGGTGNVRALKVRVGRDGHILVAGTIDGSLQIGETVITANTFDEDVFLLKLDESGQSTWLKKFGGVFEDNLRDMEIAEDGSIYLFGDFIGVLQTAEGNRLESVSRNTDLFLLQLNSEGGFLAANHLQSPSTQIAEDVCLEDDRLFISGIYRGSWHELEQDFPAADEFNGYVLVLDQGLQLESGLPILSEGGQYFPRATAVLQPGRLLQLSTYSGTIGLGDHPLVAKVGFGAGLFEILTSQIVSTPLMLQSGKEITVFPNPSTGQIRIVSEIAIERIELVDRAGLPMQVWTRSGDSLLLNDSLPAGTYFLKMHTKGGLRVEKLEIH